MACDPPVEKHCSTEHELTNDKVLVYLYPVLPEEISVWQYLTPISTGPWQACNQTCPVSYACITEWEAIHPAEVRIHSVCQGERLRAAIGFWLQQAKVSWGDGQMRMRWMTQASETMTQTVQGAHYIFSILKYSVQITVMASRTDINVVNKYGNCKRCNVIFFSQRKLSGTIKNTAAFLIWLLANIGETKLVHGNSTVVFENSRMPDFGVLLKYHYILYSIEAE